jgi:catechol 2,3-dioxygenase-like lactoylglutathione lyase family enzyme
VTIDPRVDIGHVHLKVADIDRSLGFYRDILGFDGATDHELRMNWRRGERRANPRAGHRLADSPRPDAVEH